MEDDDTTSPELGVDKQSSPEIVEETQELRGKDQCLENVNALMGVENQDNSENIINEVGEPKECSMNPGGNLNGNGGTQEVELNSKGIEPFQSIAGEKINGQNPGINSGPSLQFELGHNQSNGVKRKRAVLKSLRSKSLRPSKSLSKKYLT
ncbi:hypothetical protein L1987_67732 [Smallanthus sonchifolius]|uniref:Uncharacterized protein n=1 Tax=Smallanthus sonchifolius TaxID=185202 RepID=A0ACB9B4E0_9ASTR|nr:hypothetical protein L1987_67732 [Smallanthus sonchifolius]